MLSSGLNLVTTVIGFGMSATFIVFVCARLICGRARSSGGGARGAGVAFEFGAGIRDAAESDRHMEHLHNGLEPVHVAAIPTMKYNCEAPYSKENAQCYICLSDYKEKEMLRIMPNCLHNFHLACIDVWLQKQSTCPICRISLMEKSDTVLNIPSLLSLQHRHHEPERSHEPEQSHEPELLHDPEQPEDSLTNHNSASTPSETANAGAGDHQQSEGPPR